jgi:hypothetical protein
MSTSAVCVQSWEGGPVVDMRADAELSETSDSAWSGESSVPVVCLADDVADRVNDPGSTKASGAP